MDRRPESPPSPAELFQADDLAASALASSTSPLAGFTPQARHLLLRSVAWMDGHFDSQCNLLWYPDRTRGYSRQVLGPIHIVRESVWYATGLLLRQNPGDFERAIRILETLETYQFIAPGQDHHGTFCRYPSELQIPDSPVEWIHYDPNWREFVGLALLLILEEFSAHLPDALVATMEAMVLRAAEGSLVRGVTPIYTNVALMSAALIEAVGRRRGQAAWVREGEALGAAIFARFTPTGVVDEFNSPTYYGVSLGALAHYRRPGVSAVLGHIGGVIEASLWRDIARFYHPALRNLAGPYDRAYGMDMQRCIGLAGIWIGLIVEPGAAPLPDFDLATQQLHDICFTPHFALLGAACPAEFIPDFTAVPRRRLVEQVISRDPFRIATAWLDEGIMIGAHHCDFPRAAMDQVFPATIHWRVQSASEHQVGSICLRSPGAVDATASENRLNLTIGRLPANPEMAHLGAFLEGSLHAEFEIALPVDAGSEADLDAIELARDVWRLPGLTVWVVSNAGTWECRKVVGGFVLRYTGDASLDVLTFALRTESLESLISG